MTTPDPTQGQPPAAAPASTPAAAPASTPAQPQGQPPAQERDPDKWVPYSRFAEVNNTAAEAKAARAAAEAKAAELERKVGRLELRADLGIDDDDDADRVLSAYEKAHADVKADKRPKAKDWVRAEGVLDTLPKSIRAAYGPAWVTPPQPQTSGVPQRQTHGATPSTNRGAVTGASTPAALEDSARRTPRRPVR